MALSALLAAAAALVSVAGASIVEIHTPLLNDQEPCIAENIKETDHYICSDTTPPKVICLNGWSEPENMCRTPICEFLSQDRDDVDGDGDTEEIITKGCGEHGECIRPGVCSCCVGWEGVTCQDCIRMPGCREGFCTEAFGCTCYNDTMWTGANCDCPVCKAGCVNGYCDEPGQCICHEGWEGEDCNRCVTLPGCVNGGCVDGPLECRCHEGWCGPMCDCPICKEGCDLEHGYCTNSVPGRLFECLCQPGWEGENCTRCVKYPGCPEEASCQRPWECICPEGLDHPLCGIDCTAHALTGYFHYEMTRTCLQMNTGFHHRAEDPDIFVFPPIETDVDSPRSGENGEVPAGIPSARGDDVVHLSSEEGKEDSGAGIPSQEFRGDSDTSSVDVNATTTESAVTESRSADVHDVVVQLVVKTTPRPVATSFESQLVNDGEHHADADSTAEKKAAGEDDGRDGEGRDGAGTSTSVTQSSFRQTDDSIASGVESKSRTVAAATDTTSTTTTSTPTPTTTPSTARSESVGTAKAPRLQETEIIPEFSAASTSSTPSAEAEAVSVTADPEAPASVATTPSVETTPESPYVSTTTTTSTRPTHDTTPISIGQKDTTSINAGASSPAPPSAASLTQSAPPTGHSSRTDQRPETTDRMTSNVEGESDLTDQVVGSSTTVVAFTDLSSSFTDATTATVTDEFDIDDLFGELASEPSVGSSSSPSDLGRNLPAFRDEEIATVPVAADEATVLTTTEFAGWFVDKLDPLFLDNDWTNHGSNDEDDAFRHYDDDGDPNLRKIGRIQIEEVRRLDELNKENVERLKEEGEPILAAETIL